MSRPAILAVLLTALSLASPVMAASGHAHDDSAPPAGRLSLDHGRKWQTDSALRQGMAAIGGDLRAALGPVHDGRYSPREFDALAASVLGHIDAIARQCKLPEAADAQLHIVLADLIAATDAMKGEGGKGNGDRVGGVVSAIKALDRYQAHFDHPGWKPVGH